MTIGRGITPFALALCLLCACGSDSSDDGSGGSSGTGGSTGGSSGTAGASGGAGSGGTAGAGGSAANGSACTQPSDCRTYSSYCDGCHCLALGASDPDPPCNGTPVSCLVDPCLDREATCLGGICSLADRR